jgi:hypothetical protein
MLLPLKSATFPQPTSRKLAAEVASQPIVKRRIGREADTAFLRETFSARCRLFEAYSPTRAGAARLLAAARRLSRHEVAIRRDVLDGRNLAYVFVRTGGGVRSEAALGVEPLNIRNVIHLPLTRVTGSL